MSDPQPPDYPPPGGFPPPAGYGGGQPGGFQQPAYGYGQVDHPQGTTILVLGICSLVICSLLGPVAWIMGNNAIKEIDAAPGRFGNRGAVQAGRICGIITSVLLILLVVVIVIALIAGAASSSSS